MTQIFQSATNYVAGTEPVSVAVADVNGDGKPDLITADNVGGVDVLLGDGSGGFSTATPYAAGSTPLVVAVAVADVKPRLARWMQATQSPSPWR